ncbi:MAG TPA: hypothetical protein PKU93_01180 [Candidatus Pacearchaeota archaeon]|nr:hypothetical protein [Candidatus Pacearchaeota archaeon]
MLKRDIFIGIIIFILFVIGLVSTLENIDKKKHIEEGGSDINLIFELS